MNIKGKIVGSSMLILLIYITLFCSMDPEIEEINPDNEQNIPGWFYSNELHSNRNIYLNLPDNYDAKAGKTYPVLYLLDANWYFDGSHWRISGGGVKEIVANLISSGSIPEMIIIGIGNLDPNNRQMRGKDFHSLKTPEFLRFITDELIPKVDLKFNTKSGMSVPRVLVGHSSGAYFSTYALFQNNTDGSNLIENFISLSIWRTPDYHDIILEEESFFVRTDSEQSLNMSLYMGVGGAEEKEFLDVYNDLLDNMILHNYLGFQIKAKAYPEHYHSSYISLAIKDGLMFLFGK